MIKWIGRQLSAGGVSLILLLLLIALVIFGPLIAPYSPTESAGVPLSRPSGAHLFGTDTLGRDVLSRILLGGQLLLIMSLASTVLTYLIAIPIGMIAAVNKGVVDDILMRGVDVLIALPAMLVLLVVLSAAGSGIPIIIIGTAIVRIPLVSRVTRAATLEVFSSEYVESALTRGERIWSIFIREVMPNIKEAVFSTVGLSFTAAVLIMSSLNFLGVGLQPPSPDWGIMISENRSIFEMNPYAVLVPTLLLAILTVSISGTWDSFERRSGAKRTKTPVVPKVRASAR
ncbi:ABC transporter permease [Homoserinimonas sp. OAct 916]|uniref:ABC transporter permease n=1 Tax=Homoserinimonas sp. OAct 916 TaxID=2211450 RepID=UPI000DBEA7B5|nr:ABC transporter permease [Homoserinimonas sp. OAct 916]